MQLVIILAVRLLPQSLIPSLTPSPKLKAGRKVQWPYSVEEHVAVLQLLLSDRNAFNASESSKEW